MAIYAKNITKEQRAWCKLYQHTTGFEPMHQDELSEGKMDWGAFVRANNNWFENWMHETYNIISSDIPEAPAPPHFD